MNLRLKSLKALATFAAIVVSLCAFVLFGTAASAESKVVVSPTSLIIAATDGGIVTRTLTLRTTEPISPGTLRVLPQDLLTTDNAAAIPASSITVLLPTNSTSETIVPMTVTVNLTGARFGDYVGELVIVHSGGELIMPVKASVKQGWFFPLLIIALSVFIGILINTYRTQGKVRDETQMQLTQLRERLKSETAFTDDDTKEATSPFKERINGLITNAQTLLDDGDVENARKQLAEARTRWGVWAQYRSSWLTELAACLSLTARIQQITPSSSFLEALAEQTETLRRSAPDLTGPDKLRADLTTPRGQFNTYATLANVLKLCADRPADKVKVIHDEAEGLRTQLDQSSLTSLTDATWKEVRVKADRLLDQVKQIEASSMARGMGSLGPSDLLSLLGATPNIQALSAEEQAKAGERLRQFVTVSLFIGGLILAALGFNELYVNKAAFGAFGDYLALVLWGFGAEATRASVSSLVNTLGVPGNWKASAADDAATK